MYLVSSTIVIVLFNIVKLFFKLTVNFPNMFNLFYNHQNHIKLFTYI